MNEGWICPRCQKVNAPGVKQCNCKSYENLKEQHDDLEILKKLLEDNKSVPKEPEPIRYYTDWRYYPDWGYWPYWLYTYYLGLYTTTSGNATDKE